MKAGFAGGVLLIGFAVLVGAALQAEEVTSGPGKKTGGAFNVKAITGGQAGKTLCYV